MKRFVFTAIALVLIGPSTAQNAQMEPTLVMDLTKAPKITFSQPDFDFGDVYEGGVINHVFHFQNLGFSNLSVKNVRAACSCTASTPPLSGFLPDGQQIEQNHN